MYISSAQHRFLCPPWQKVQLESKELMAACLRKIPGLSKVKLIGDNHAKFEHAFKIHLHEKSWQLIFAFGVEITLFPCPIAAKSLLAFSLSFIMRDFYSVKCNSVQTEENNDK